MRRQAEGPPDTTDRALAQPTARGHGPGTPVGGLAGCPLQRERHHLLHLRIGNASRGSRTGLIQHPVEPRGQKATAPLAHGLLGQPQLARDLGVRAATGARQHESRSLGERLRRRRPTRPAFQGLAFVVGERQHRNGTADRHERSPFYRENARRVQVVPSFSDSRD